MKIAQDATPAPDDTTPLSVDALVMPAANGKGKVRLLTRESLDGRTRARKQFDAIAEAIAKDVGDERMSTVRRHLIEAFAGAALQVSDMNARLLLGQPVDVAEHGAAISMLARLASRLPLDRAAKSVQPDFYKEILPRLAEQQDTQPAQETEPQEINGVDDDPVF